MKKQARKQLPGFFVKHRRRLTALVVVVVLVVSGYLAIVWLDNKYGPQIKENHKGKTVADTMEAVTRYSMRGRVYTQGIVDKGCQKIKHKMSSPIRCTIAARNFYIGKGNPVLPMDTLMKELRADYWIHYDGRGNPTMDLDFFRGKVNDKIRLHNLDRSYKLELSFYSATGAKSTILNEVLGAETLLTLEADEYVYGFSTETDYWQCSEGDMLHPNPECPDPPFDTKMREM
ncbi:hypothetical protein JNJ66_02745 [Candidatus Saccharibacteria bacterium]|nr:hypothetical protein [Candidatus Saccharibacteria bacterium]